MTDNATNADPGLLSPTHGREEPITPSGVKHLPWEDSNMSKRGHYGLLPLGGAVRSLSATTVRGPRTVVDWAYYALAPRSASVGPSAAQRLLVLRDVPPADRACVRALAN